MMDENDDIRRITPILIREICVNLCPIFEGVTLGLGPLRKLFSTDTLITHAGV